MAISFQVLGRPGRDNALFVKVDTGQQVTRLLFDCGDGCPHTLPFHELISVDHLFFSHMHMDHVGGFDSFFRANHDRELKPNHLWGPADSAEILQHRFRGFLWNLMGNAPAVSWHVHEIHPGEVRSIAFELREAFRESHEEGSRPWNKVAFEGAGFTVESHLMDHGTPSVAYVVREPDRVNVDVEKLAASGLGQGAWLKQLRGPRASDGATVDIGGVPHSLAALQEQLLITTAGDSIAYLTDFRMDEKAQSYLAEQLKGVNTVVCECQYRVEDRELAVRNWHMAADEVATMAAKAGVGQLTLFHLSDRYQPHEWKLMLSEAQAIFPNSSFPVGWNF